MKSTASPSRSWQKAANTPSGQYFSYCHQQIRQGVAKDEICARYFRRMKAQLTDRQAGKTLIDYVSDSALLLSTKSVANNCEVKFFLFGKVVIRGIGHRHCFVTLFLEDELPSSTEDL